MTPLWLTPLESARLVYKEAGIKRCLVAFSGGKDSIAVLALAVEAYGEENVEAYMMCLVQDLACEMDAIRRALRRFPKVKLHTVTHWTKSKMVREGILRHFALPDVRLVKQVDVENYMRAKTGIGFIAYGMKCIDGLLRNAMMKKTRNQTGDALGIDRKTKRLNPLAAWSHKQVISFLRAKKLPIPVPDGRGGTSNGMSMTCQWLSWCEEKHPNDFKKICVDFPLAPAQVLKWRQRQDVVPPKRRRKTVPLPEVRPSADGAERSEERAVQPAGH